MVGLPYETRVGDPRKDPEGKVSWIVDDGAWSATPATSSTTSRPAALTPARRALALTVRRMLEERL